MYNLYNFLTSNYFFLKILIPILSLLKDINHQYLIIFYKFFFKKLKINKLFFPFFQYLIYEMLIVIYKIELIVPKKIIKYKIFRIF